MMNWNQLICDTRLGQELYAEKKGGVRSEFERDFDRLIFSSPFRRLQNKTQVFPLPGSIFVHNRLTHSLEVSCVGRSLANEIAQLLFPKYAHEPWHHKLLRMGEIVAAACLAHDLGNPPFGHSGEKTIGAYFSEGNGLEMRHLVNEKQWADLIHFEGNANSFRTLVHQFNGRRPGGFAMTYSTLASIVKYPFSSSQANKAGKFGFFTTERETYERIAEKLGIIRIAEEKYARHPLVYLVEAADDICYQIMDIEDAHKLKVLSTEETTAVLLHFFSGERRNHIEQVMETVDDPNERIVYLRSCIIGQLVQECAKAFTEHEQEILNGELKGCLIDYLPQDITHAYKNCSNLAYSKLYKHSYVVDVDMAGDRIINFLLNKLLDAVLHPEKNYSKLLLSKFPQQYDIYAHTDFERILAVIDHISAMTDVYALNLYRQLSGINLPTV